MPRLTLLHRILRLKVRTVIFCGLAIFAIIQTHNYCRSYNYDHIPHEEIQNVLHRETNPNLKLRLDLPYCQYDELLNNKTFVSASEATRVVDIPTQGLVNGSYSPDYCNPQFSVAIIVVYRNRPQQLNIFLSYMHNFLRKQHIHYKIYIVEQQDQRDFNRGSLFNVGAKIAIAEGFPCLVLHDVDLLPLSRSGLYACTGRPRHMSAAIDKFRYVLTYRDLVGGVLAVRADHFTAVNGFSNRFFGWGGEDDDFSRRLKQNHLFVIRFPPHMSHYTMILHKQEPKNSERFKILEEVEHETDDGVDTVKYTMKVFNYKLFTLIGVKFP